MKFTYPPESRPLEGYTIRRAIYRGGFGEVYYAETDAGREVALKLLQNNAEIELRGVQHCLNLSHPNLVTIFDIRQDGDGDHWIIMEYVSGDTLDEVLRKAPQGLPVETVRKWLHGLTAGMSYLHSRGLVHRDLKPANLFMENGIVKIGDVGLSKFISPSRHSAQTQSVGTVHYMAPEVAKGKYGREVDIYALGVILYEMLTGELPFGGESTGEILMKHLTATPDLSKLPPRLQGVIGKALQKDPQQRYSRVEALQRAFDDAVLGIASAESEEPEHAAARQPGVGTGATSTTAQGTVGEALRLQPSRIPVWLIGAGIGLLAGAGLQITEAALPGLNTLTSAWVLFLTGTVLGVFAEQLQARRQARQLASGRQADSRHRLFQTTLASVPEQPTCSVSYHSTLLGSLFAVVPISLVLATLMFTLKPSLLSGGGTVHTGLIGMFTLVTIFASWGLLTLPHLQPAAQRRKKNPAFHYAAAGAVTGLFAFAIDRYLLLGPLGDITNAALVKLGDHDLVHLGSPTLLGYLLFFATFFALRNWHEMLTPWRNKRFSVSSVLFTVFTAWLASMIFAFPGGLALAWGVMLGCVIQLAAPLSEAPRHRFGQRLN